MKKIFLLQFIFYYLFCSSQINPNDDFNDLFVINKDDRGMSFVLIQELEIGNKYFAFKGFEEYLRMTHDAIFNLSSGKEYEGVEDSIEYNQIFKNKLNEDSLFNFQKHYTLSILNKDVEFKLDTFTLDEVLNIAVKYFSINNINEKGHYLGRVCGGLNSLSETESDRNVYLESFCFNSILKNYYGELSLYDEFVKSIKELYKINLGIDEKDRLLRAQGAMYMLMRKNQILKEVLIKEFKNYKNILPFVVIE